MIKKPSIFCSGKFLIFNITLFSLILGFVISTLFYISCTNNNQAQGTFHQVLAQDTSNSRQGGKPGLQDLQADFNEVASQVLPVVVEINTLEVIKQQEPKSQSPFDYFFEPEHQQQKQKKEPPDGEFQRPGLGSGIIVRDEGDRVYVVTNYHVVGNADSISVLLYDGREFEARIVGKDQRTDMALVSFEAQGDFPVAKLANASNIKVGDWALAVGNPFGFESTVTAGIISAVGRSPEGTDNVSTFVDYLQTDASINPGNSGGGLFNIHGELVGINTWIASQTGGSIGLGFAIPVNVVQKAIADLVRVGKVVYGWLGVQIADDKLEYYQNIAESLNTAGKKGGLVLNVFMGSPADKSGIQPGDFITRIGTVDIEDSNHLTRVVGMLSAGQTTNFSLIRYGKELEISAKIETRAEEIQIQSNNNLWPGAIIFPLSDDIRRQYDITASVHGVFIAQLVEGSPAGESGFKIGDVIVRIANTRVSNLIDFYRVVNQNRDGISFHVWRQGREVPVTLAKKRN